MRVEMGCTYRRTYRRTYVYGLHLHVVNFFVFTVFHAGFLNDGPYCRSATAPRRACVTPHGKYRYQLRSNIVGPKLSE